MLIVSVLWLYRTWTKLIAVLGFTLLQGPGSLRSAPLW
jgi:hypothetical protein